MKNNTLEHNKACAHARKYACIALYRMMLLQTDREREIAHKLLQKQQELDEWKNFQFQKQDLEYKLLSVTTEHYFDAFAADVKTHGDTDLEKFTLHGLDHIAKECVVNTETNEKQKCIEVKTDEEMNFLFIVIYPEQLIIYERKLEGLLNNQ